MINLKIIYKIVGSLLFIEAALLLICLGIALSYGEEDTVAFGVSVGVTALCGLLLRLMAHDSDNTLSRRDAYLVVALSWVIFSLFGTLPFLLSGYITNFTDAFFETMSGFTTTGATVIDHIDGFPHALLFWRSLTQWIGGLGIVFFTIALLPSLVGGSVKVFAAEATGPIKTKLHPRLSTSAKWIWIVYLLITVLCCASLCAVGMDVFDSVNYSMSTAATGGFATKSALVLFTPQVEYVITLFCFVSGINFTLLYASATKFRPGMLLKNSEFRFYLTLVVVLTLFVAGELVWSNHYTVEHALRSAVFHIVSFITTTGLVNDDAGRWPQVTWAALAVCMFFGACSGSTSGGFKCVRGVMLLKAIRNEFKQILHPNAVLPLRIDGVNVPNTKRLTLLSFLTIYIMLGLVCTFAMITSGVDFGNAMAITLSCLSNVGPTLGLDIGPAMSWSMLPDFAKWVCAVLMLIGRLEIFTVLVIFTPEFWKEN